MKRRWWLLGGSLVACALLLELAARVTLAYRLGADVLFYGTRGQIFGRAAPLFPKDWWRNHSVATHTATGGKYAPHQKRVDHDADGKSFTVGINGYGFRGGEWSVAKKPGTFRIVTLGASSTFGYGDRDDETYPAQLERLLREKCPGRAFEVLNLGIPHLRAREIAALYARDGTPLRPDLVTFYEGVNDASAAVEAQWPWGKQLATARLPFESLVSRSLFAALVASPLQGPRRVIHARPSEIAAAIERASADFVPSLDEIARHAPLLVATQAMRSASWDRREIDQMTAAEEARVLAGRSSLLYNDLVFLVQSALMERVRSRADFVDVARSLDGHRRELFSWVHLTPHGNQIVAEKLAERIRCGNP